MNQADGLFHGKERTFWSGKEGCKEYDCKNIFAQKKIKIHIPRSHLKKNR
jgi:hypothetical protein